MKKTKSIVAIVKGTQYEATRKALSLIRNEIKPPKNSQILLKPNLLSSKKSQLVNTDPRVCLAAYDFFKEEKGINDIIIGEGTTYKTPKVKVSMKNNEYFKYKKDWRYIDFAEDEPEKWFKIYEAIGERNLELGIAKSVINSKYLVSIPKLKTHDVLGLTLSLKNFMG